MNNLSSTTKTAGLLAKAFVFRSLCIKFFIGVIIILVTGCQLNANHLETNLEAEMKKIEIGDIIPDIILNDQNGNLYNLKAETKGKNVVLYFYPKDDTKGCTAQACSFRDQFEDFYNLNAVIIGISGQSVESHKKFAAKYNLPFTLLSDEGDKIRKMFGVPTNLFGLIPGRVTYVINPQHKVIDIYNSQMNIRNHIENSLKTLNSE